MQNCILKADLADPQHWSLHFNNPALEAKFRVDNRKYQELSLQAATCGYFFLAVLLMLSSQARPALLLLSLCSLFSAVWLRQRNEYALCCLLQVFMISSALAPHSDGALLGLLGIRMFPMLVHYFCLKRWTWFLLNSAVESAVCRVGSPWAALSAVALCTLAYSLLENDYRNLWWLRHLLNKGYNLLNELHYHSLNASFLLNSQGEIVLLNKKAESLFALHPPQRLAEAFGATGREIFNFQFSEAVMHRRVTEEEYVLKPHKEILKLEETAELAISLKIRPLHREYFEVTCSDLTPVIITRAITLYVIKKMNFTLKSYQQDLLRNYQKNQLTNTELLADFFKISFTIQSLYVLESSLLGEVESKVESFNVNVECEAIFDICFSRASLKGLTMYFLKDQSIPNALRCDKRLHDLMVYSLLQFAICHSERAGDIQLSVQALNTVDFCMTVAYKLQFTSKDITTQDIAACLRPNKRKTIEQVSHCIRKNGLELTVIAMCAQLIARRHPEPILHQDNRKISIHIKIPFDMTAGGAYATTPRMHYESLETSLSVKWAPKPLLGRLPPTRINLIPVSLTSSLGIFSEAEVSANKPSLWRRPVLFKLASKSPDDSDIDDDSDIELDFPCRTSRLELPLNTVSRPRHQPGPPLFLVIEGNVSVRKRLTRLLEVVAGATVDQAATAQEAIGLFKNYAARGFMYQVIFLATVLPGSSGLEAAALIRSIEHEQHYDASYLCGLAAESAEFPQCISAGMNVAVLNSSSSAEFRALLDSVLSANSL